jgi:hypothetical protein
MSFADLELLRQGVRPEPLVQAICDFLDKQPSLVDRVRRSGGMRWLCRTARSGLVALHRSGVGFRTCAGRRWKPPVLEPWEEPVDDLEQPMVWHPAVLRQWCADKERWRARRRVRDAAQRAIAAGYEGAQAPAARETAS